MTRNSEKDYIETTLNQNAIVVSTDADRWRGLPSTPPLDPTETPRCNLLIHLKQ
jgi:hypothetical protein